MTGAADELLAWVDALTDENELWERIPECWAEHPGVVTEFDTLMQLSQQAAKPADVVAFQDALDRVLHRLVDQYPTAECLKDRRHAEPYRWASRPDIRGDLRRAERVRANAEIQRRGPGG